MHGIKRGAGPLRPDAACFQSCGMSQRTEFDPLRLLDALHAGAERNCAFTATATETAREWQARARRVLTRYLGFLDRPAPPVEAEVEQAVDRGSYVRERVVLRTWPDATMPVYVLVPKGLTGPAPCVLALHGHGYGVRDIVGLWEDGSERWEPDGYHKDFGCALAERGFVVAAPEISCFGERRADYSALADELAGPEPSTCHNANTYAIMLGGSVMGLRVWDGMRAVDYLATRPEADIARLGAMGISGGGAHTYFSTACDDRIRACVISGYFCDWRLSILTFAHCTCNFVPGLLGHGELSDFAGLIAPRPCLIEAGRRDTIFPIDGVRAAVDQGAGGVARLRRRGHAGHRRLRRPAPDQRPSCLRLPGAPSLTERARTAFRAGRARRTWRSGSR